MDRIKWLNDITAHTIARKLSDVGLWDEEMAHDSAAGKLDFLIEEATTERNAGTLIYL